MGTKNNIFFFDIICEIKSKFFVLLFEKVHHSENIKYSSSLINNYKELITFLFFSDSNNSSFDCKKVDSFTIELFTSLNSFYKFIICIRISCKKIILNKKINSSLK